MWEEEVRIYGTPGVPNNFPKTVYKVALDAFSQIKFTRTHWDIPYMFQPLFIRINIHYYLLLIFFCILYIIIFFSFFKGLCTLYH